MATLRGTTQHFEVYYDNLLAFPTRGIVSISRNANQLDLFIVGNNGVVYSDWWTAGSDWWSAGNNWLPIGASFPTGAPVAAVSRDPNQLDLFVVGNDGVVYTAGWTAGSTWTGNYNNWRPIGGIFPAGARITAVSRSPNQIDLFVVGNDGIVYTSWWTAGSDWSGVNNNWRPIGGFFPVAAPIAAVARNPNQLDLFIGGNDGVVYTSWWTAGSDWSGVNNDWRPIGGFFPVAAPIAAVSRSPGQLDLFIVGNDGVVYTNWWTTASDWSGVNNDWRPIGGFFPLAAPIAAVSRNPGQLDLFIVGNDGVVYTSWWTAGTDWSGANNNWRPIGGFFPAGATIAVVSRNPTQLDLFVVGNDGAVYTSWWAGPNTDWSGVNDDWRDLGAPGPTLADALLSTCERDYRQLQDWFGQIDIDDLPFKVTVQPGANGARHDGCSSTEITCDSFSGTDLNLIRYLLVSEVDEVFMDNQNAGWKCGSSNGEALSRVLAGEIYPQEATPLQGSPSFSAANSWLNNNRPDWVNNTESTDKDFISIGCGTLFINWMQYQLGFTVNRIAQAGGDTLAETYRKLCDRPDAFQRFSALLASKFPLGSSASLPNDNPFPIFDKPQWSGLCGWRGVGGTFPPSAEVAAVSRNPNQLDLFIVGNDGVVYTSWWTAGSDWSGVNDNWRPIGGFFPAGAPVAAVSRNPNQLDLFVVGNDGVVYTSWWTAGSDWSGVNNNWRPIGGFFRVGAPIAAVSRNPNQLDLFVVGNDGVVYTSWWTAGSDWSGVNNNWRPIGGVFPAGAPVCAVSRDSNQLDLFIVGVDGVVYTSWWTAGSDWSGVNNDWRPIGGFFASNRPVSVVSRNRDQLDLFIVGIDGIVYTNWWSAGSDWSGVNNNWRPIGGFFPTGNRIAAVSRNPGQIDLFVVGNDGGIYTSWWTAGSDWSGVNNNWYLVSTVETAPKLAGPSAIARTLDHLDVFVVGNDGRVYTAWWPQ